MMSPQELLQWFFYRPDTLPVTQPTASNCPVVVTDILVVAELIALSYIIQKLVKQLIDVPSANEAVFVTFSHSDISTNVGCWFDCS